MPSKKITPIFITKNIIFPEEKKEIVISEPLNKQFFHYVIEEEKEIGMVCSINNKISIFGTLIRIKGVKHINQNGDITISIEGLKRFKIQKLFKNNLFHRYPAGELLLINDTEFDVKNNNIQLIKIYEQNSSSKIKKPLYQLSFKIASLLKIKNNKKVFLMSIDNEQSRQKILLGYLKEESKI